MWWVRNPNPLPYLPPILHGQHLHTEVPLAILTQTEKCTTFHLRALLSRCKDKGEWSEVKEVRWKSLAAGKSSNHPIVSKALSNRSGIWTPSVVWYNQVKFGPTKPISLRLHQLMVSTKFPIYCRGLSLPPSFSDIFVISINSPIIKHGNSDVPLRCPSFFQDSSFLFV